LASIALKNCSWWERAYR